MKKEESDRYRSSLPFYGIKTLEMCKHPIKPGKVTILEHKAAVHLVWCVQNVLFFYRDAFTISGYPAPKEVSMNF